MRRFYRVGDDVVDERPRTFETVDPATGELVEAWAVPHPDEFMDSDFLEDERLDELLEEVIAAFPEFEFLERWRVRILWKSAIGGKHPLGTCQLASGLIAHFGKADFIILLSAEDVRIRVFRPKQVEALIYHELLHCTEKVGRMETKPAIRPHDLEVFAGELKHYGAWRSAIEGMRRPFRELEAMLAIPDSEVSG